MKKILLSLISVTFIGLSQISAADELLAWAQYGTGTWVAPGCQWNAGGATPSGPVYSLSCAGSTGGSATRASNLPAPEIVSAGGTYYVVPRVGGAGTPINGYNYAIYKRPTSTCAAHGVTVGYYPYLQTASANISSDAQKCGSGCSIDIMPNGAQYKNVCR